MLKHGYKSIKAEYYGLDDLTELIKDIKLAKEVMELVDSKTEGKCEEWTKEKHHIMESMLESKFEMSEAFRTSLMGSEDSLLLVKPLGTWNM